MDEKNPVIFLFMMLGLKYFMCSKAKTLNTFSMVLEHSCTWMVEKLTFLLMMFGLNIAWYAKISEFSTIYVHVQYISLYCL